MDQFIAALGFTLGILGATAVFAIGLATLSLVFVMAFDAADRLLDALRARKARKEGR